MKDLNRRRVLRGVLGGSAVTVALPLLNAYLNGNATAMADGKPMPVRFGAWFWGLGMNRDIFVPKQLGANYELPLEVAALKPIQKHMNMFTDYVAFRDASPNMCHYSGWVIARTGQAPNTGVERPAETIDVTIANKIGRTTRFKLLVATATGDVRTTTSWSGTNSVNAAEFSPMAFYTRLFGPGFQDPNAPEFVPSARVMVRKSVLSGVMDDVKDLNQYFGSEDRARLDQYFTGLRTLEHQMQQQLTKPEPIASCTPVKAPKGDPAPGVESDMLTNRHKMMTDLMAMAVACDQTRVVNMNYTAGNANTTKMGYDKPHHTVTHEEPRDEAIGYQPMVSWFTQRCMDNWLYFVESFQKIKEGDGTVLDNMFIMANTDHALARVHQLDQMPMFSAGRAGGKMKTGLHISGKNETSLSELGFTALRTFGVDINVWGTKSNQTSRVISDILV